MKFAYADPPYLGCGKLYAKEHPEALSWNSLDTHKDLINRLCDEFPDGWAMSASSPSLQKLLPLCPDDVRVMAWVKPFCAWKKGVFPPYSWEPVIVRGGRKQSLYKDQLPNNYQLPLRDYIDAPIMLKKGLTGAKPPRVCLWIFCVLGAEQGDTLDDLFPGTGIVQHTWDEWQSTGETDDRHSQLL